MSGQNIEIPSTPGNNFALKSSYNYRKIRVKSNGNCLRQYSIYFIQRNAIILYIVY